MQGVPIPVPLSGYGYPILQNERISQTLRGEKPDRLPIWIMGQTGPYLPEYLQYTRQDTFLNMTPEIFADIMLMPIRRINTDAVVMMNNIWAIPQALGMTIEMLPSGEAVINEPLNVVTIMGLRVQGAIHRLKYVGDGIKLARQNVFAKIPIFGFSTAPWTLMCYMIEGSTTKTLSRSKYWLYAHPAESHGLLQLLTEVIIDYLVLQVRSGAEMLYILDSNAGCLNKNLYSTFCLPYLRWICDSVKKRVQRNIPMALFAKGAHYCLPEQADLGYDIIGIDYTVEPRVVREIFKDTNITIQGNLDPCALYTTKRQLRDIVERMVEGFGKERYIVSLGDGIHPDTRPGSLAILMDVVHDIRL